jgi:hypothetical protein
MKAPDKERGMSGLIEWKKLSASNGDSHKGYIAGLNICDIINVVRGDYLLSFYEGGLPHFTTLKSAKAKAEELLQAWLDKSGLIPRDQITSCDKCGDSGIWKHDEGGKYTKLLITEPCPCLNSPTSLATLKREARNESST